MQLALFEECRLDDESNKCKQLTAAMEEMVSAVEKRASSHFYQTGVLKPSALSLQFGPTAVQTAASKLRSAASISVPSRRPPPMRGSRRRRPATCPMQAAP